ncbi:hypothetical protein T05_6011 [Trichinella murrelli]|uniref:Uncharacterized protein n=1 Tax=Trichinella murrelli TaxID=144512 RepID=A0A0V0T5H2_9BILA|nr:hypothetical protein T05_6011 [Trichinella murrelli]
MILVTLKYAILFTRSCSLHHQWIHVQRLIRNVLRGQKATALAISEYPRTMVQEVAGIQATGQQRKTRHDMSNQSWPPGASQTIIAN